MEKFKRFCHEINICNMCIKLSIITAFIIIGFFVHTFMYLAAILACIFISLEWDVNSLYFVIYLLPFMHVFTFSNSYGLSFWNLLVVFYVMIQTIRYMIMLIKKKINLKYKLIIPLILFIVYVCLPIGHSFNLFGVLEFIVWVDLFFILIEFRKDLNVLNTYWFFLAGIFVSSLIAIFIPYISYLSDLIITYYAYNVARFSGLMLNPNIFYELCLTALALLYVFIYNKKVNSWFMLLTVPLGILSIMTISKTVLICLIVLVALAFLSALIKANKFKLRQLGIFLLCLAFASVCVLPFTKTLLRRGDIENNYSTTSDNHSQSTSATDNSTLADVIFTDRVTLWKIYLEDLQNDSVTLIFGNGIGSATGLVESNSHNSYVQIIYELGIIGAILFIGLCVYLVVYFRLLNKKFFYSFIYIPLIIMCCYYFTENHFLSQLGNMMLILSVLPFKIISKE